MRSEAESETESITIDPALDNPVWSALSSVHRHLAVRYGRAARYPEDVSPLAALARPSESALADLAGIVAPGGVVAIPGLDGVAIPPDAWERMGEPLPLLQMVCRASLAPPTIAATPLTPADVPEMLRLVEATEPGPFARRTIELGRYLGVRQDGRLVAMAGERLALEGATEVSAVCTDPAFRGRGLGEELVRAIGTEIQRAGRRPFLHVLEDNRGAIALYQRLGFEIRTKRPLCVLARR